MKAIVNGAKGRMGQAVMAGLTAQGHEIAALIDPFMDVKTISDCSATADVIIDFSSPAALTDLLAYSKAKKMPLVLATTGYSPEQLQQIEAAAQEAPIFKSANMSLGINLLKRLIQTAAKVLGNDFDCEIVETHHNQKKDAPSGTALLLYDALISAYDTPHEMQPSRHGMDCKRDPKEIGIHAIRGGTVPGIHEVGFYGNNETITLTHSAQSREVFAQGAIKAAQFMVGKGPGFYSMDELLEGIE